jgi:hypothetical protein
MSPTPRRAGCARCSPRTSTYRTRASSRTRIRPIGGYVIRDHLPHDVIRHEPEYMQGEIRSQNIDACWAILKRGLYGVYHHMDEDYLPCYLSEFEFRFNRRKASDA